MKQIKKKKSENLTRISIYTTCHEYNIIIILTGREQAESWNMLSESK